VKYRESPSAAPFSGRAFAAAYACAAILLVAAGCTSTSGSLFRPRRHKLLPAAQDISRAAAGAATLPKELAKDILADYQVEPGDVLLVEPAAADSDLRLPGDQTVQPDGTIDLGRFGQLLVAYRTVDEIRADVRARFAEQGAEDEKIAVRVLQTEGTVYYVIGEVNSPGAYPLKGHETVLDAIVAAGDLTDRANRRKIVLSRPTDAGQCPVVLPICYRHIVQMGDTSTNYQLLPGDRIFVASLSFCEGLRQLCAGDDDDQCPGDSGR